MDTKITLPDPETIPTSEELDNLDPLPRYENDPHKYEDYLEEELWP